MSRLIVIGGGPAGMMAAIAAAEAAAGMPAKEPLEVHLIERNEKLGKKLFITGKGRCNVTNACEPEAFFPNVISNPKFLYSAFYDYDNGMVQSFFENNGCHLKTERGDRVFPASDHSSDIIRALEKSLKKLNVRVSLHTRVRELVTKEGGQRISGVVLENGERETAESVIVATGGCSYPATGSTGDGYRFAESCGHTAITVRPSLVPLEIKEGFCKNLMGLSLKNVEITLFQEKKKLYQGFGEMLFTHFGVSGPLILSASADYVKKAYGKEAVLQIDLKPALDLRQLDKRLLRDFEENKNKAFKNALGGLFPARLIPVMIQLSGVEPEKKVHEVTREERERLCGLFKAVPLTVTGCRGFEEAIISQGGVSCKEINPSTMESKLVKGLYFAGEVLDSDALTGGFNLQIAWSTGHLAGVSCAAALQKKGE